MERTYLAIDLKSFYASVECVERGLDPMTTNLVVADSSRTEKTICLAVSPSLKSYGISGRSRLFEVIQRVREVNADRRRKRARTGFTGASFDAVALKNDPSLELSYLVAPPRMRLYMDYSCRIYEIYLKYVAPEDIHVYSIDECFLDVTAYLSLYHMTARELAMTIIREILCTTKITATCGIGTNLYLCKVAMDIVAKHAAPDKNGVRIGELDELSYRKLLWSHTPITDFWRVGSGYAKKLSEHGLFTMGDIARCSVGAPTDYYNEDLLYKLFGINAELLIDHAWGWEPVTMKEIKAYKPATNSISSGQVLHCPYTAEKARIIVREMTELLVLDLVDKGLVTDQMVLTIGYDRESLNGGKYKGPIVTDHYGRQIPKHAHGTVTLSGHTNSTKQIMDSMMALFDRIVDKTLLVRRVTIVAGRVISEQDMRKENAVEQMSLFVDYEELARKQQSLQREKQMQKAMLSIQKKYGKNAVLKGTNLQEGATTRERNLQIGGHKG